MAKGSVGEYGIIQITHHYLWKKQSPWLSNRRSVCRLPMLFTAENYPAAKVISKGNPKASSAQQGRGSENNVLLAGHPGSTSMKEHLKDSPRYHSASPKRMQGFLNSHWTATPGRPLGLEPAQGGSGVAMCPGACSCTPHHVSACPTTQHYPDF